MVRLAYDDVSWVRMTRETRAERVRRAPRIGVSRTKHHHYPVRLVDEGILRIDWKGPSSSVRPRIEGALECLGALLPVEAEARLEGRTLSSRDRRELDDRILELAEQGRVVAAVNLTRRAYG